MPAALLLVAPPGPAAAQLADRRPEELNDLNPEENLSGQVPLDVPFVDSNGKKITLSDCFDGTRPVILTMNYSNCPMLCSLQLNGLFEALGKIDWDIGHNFQMITVSIDPKETPRRAQATKEKYLKVYGRPGVAESWHVLTGTKRSIDRVANAVGFKYRYLPDKDQYAHPAVFMVLTPEGKVSRYLYGVKFDPKTIRLALLEASEGKVGTTADQVLLFCFQYDPQSGSYVPAAYRIMQAGGVLIMVALGGLIGGLMLVRRARRGRSGKTSPAPAGEANDPAAEQPPESDEGPLASQQ